jgi:RNA polymerase sigma-70 factor (ECF subfamily)
MRRGDPQATSRFLCRMRCVSTSLAAQNVRSGRPLNEQDIEDVSQEVIVMIWNKADTFAGLSALETWGCRFASFEFVTAVRRKRIRQRVAELGEEPEGADTADTQERFIEYEHLYSALGRLRPDEATVIRLKHFHGMTFPEIACRLTIPANTAKTKYYRGLIKLYEALHAVGGPGSRRRRSCG